VFTTSKPIRSGLRRCQFSYDIIFKQTFLLLDRS